MGNGHAGFVAVSVLSSIILGCLTHFWLCKLHKVCLKLKFQKGFPPPTEEYFISVIKCNQMYFTLQAHYRINILFRRALKICLNVTLDEPKNSSMRLCAYIT